MGAAHCAAPEGAGWLLAPGAPCSADDEARILSAARRRGRCGMLARSAVVLEEGDGRGEGANARIDGFRCRRALRVTLLDVLWHACVDAMDPLFLYPAPGSFDQTFSGTSNKKT